MSALSWGCTNLIHVPLDVSGLGNEAILLFLLWPLSTVAPARSTYEQTSK